MMEKINFGQEAKASLFGAIYSKGSPHLITKKGDKCGIKILKITGGTVALASLTVLMLAEMVARAVLSIFALLIFPFIPANSSVGYKKHFFDPVLAGTFKSGFGAMSALAHAITNVFPKR